MTCWEQRPSGSNWGDFGVDDQRGRLNLLTPERAHSCHRGSAYREIVLPELPDLPGGNVLSPSRHPPRRDPTVRTHSLPSVNYPLSTDFPGYTDVECDEVVTIYTQYSTEWDALAHMGQYFDADGDGTAEMVYYNGYRAGVDIIGADIDGGPAARALGIEKMAETCVQGRGVMVDLHAHFGSDWRAVDYDDFMSVLEKDRVIIEEGDMLCVHSGYGEAVVRMNGRPDARVLHHSHCALDGRDERLLRWIDNSGLAVLISDNFAVEAFPSKPGAGDHFAGLPLHEACLFKLGIHLGELWYLTELASWLRRSGRSRFLLTAPPLRLPGGFGSPVTPVATV